MNVSKPITLTTKAPQFEEALPRSNQLSINIGQITEAEDLFTLPVKMAVDGLSIFYGKFRAINDISMNIPKNRITALIGPSGCGKSTLLRSLNRMNDLIQGPTGKPGGFWMAKISTNLMWTLSPSARVGWFFSAQPIPNERVREYCFRSSVYGIRKKSTLADIVK